MSRVEKMKNRYGLWKSKRQYKKVVEHIQATNKCPLCGQSDPDVVKVYKNTVPRPDEHDKPWMASMMCSRTGCNTAWSSPQSLAGLM